MSHMLLLLLLSSGSATPQVAPLVLVVERSGQVLQYTCNEKRLDPKRLLTGIEEALSRELPGTTPVRVLYGEGVPLSEPFELASLLQALQLNLWSQSGKKASDHGPHGQRRLVKGESGSRARGISTVFAPWHRRRLALAP